MEVDNTTATLAIPRALAGGKTAHWLPVHLSLKGQKKKLDGLSDAELGPFAPGGMGQEAAAPATSPPPQTDVDAPSSDQQQQMQQQQQQRSAVGSAPASAALEASLRGRALAGARWPLPPGVGGLVLEPAPELDMEDDMEEEDDPYDDGDDDGYGGGADGQPQWQKQQRRLGSGGRGGGGGGGGNAAPRQRSWRAVAAFSELVAWNHDTAPAPTDAAWRLMDFLAVSAAAHGVVTAAAAGAAASATAPPPITAADVDAELLRAG